MESSTETPISQTLRPLGGQMLLQVRKQDVSLELIGTLLKGEELNRRRAKLGNSRFTKTLRRDLTLVNPFLFVKISNRVRLVLVFPIKR